MKYEKIDSCENGCMLFSEPHDKDTHCMHCNKSMYVEVVDEDGATVATRVPAK
jgi:hypothetical protein